jgi:uncharacterized protein (DUF58 family)
MVGLAAVTGYWMFYRGAYVLGGLVALCLLWSRINLRGLAITVERSLERLQVGQKAEARVRLKSASAITKVWLEVEDETDLPGAVAKTIVTLPAKSIRNWKLQVPCRRRGVFSAGPVRVTTGDPFGLFRFSRRYGESHPLLVLPQPEELPYFWAPTAQLPGEGTRRKRTHYVTPNASGVREYQAGDSFNRIHWPSTARLSRLMVKTFEMDPTSNIWVALDMHGPGHVGDGDDSSEEYGVRVAASVASYFLQRNRMLGFLAQGRESVLLDPARGPGQLARVLEALALSKAEGEAPLARMLEEESRRFGRHTTLIVITPSMDEEWVATLQSLVQRGTRAVAVMLDAGSFGGEEGTLLPLSTLVASNILTYVVRRGDDLSLALGPAGVAGEPMAQPQKAWAG